MTRLTARQSNCKWLSGFFDIADCEAPMEQQTLDDPGCWEGGELNNGIRWQFGDSATVEKETTVECFGETVWNFDVKFSTI